MSDLAEAQGSPIWDKLAQTDQSVSIVFGNTILPLKTALRWSEGTLIELVQETEEPFNVLVNGKLCFRGEVVVVGDTYGIRITEIVEE